MNRGLLGWPKGREFDPAMFGWPLGVNADAISRMPPVADYYTWYDSAHFASLTIVSDLITTWADRSSNAFDMVQATSTAQPGYNASRYRKINGITVPDFDTADVLRNQDADIGGTTTLTGFAVVEGDTLGGGDYRFVMGHTPFSNGFEWGIFNGSYGFGRSGSGFQNMTAKLPQVGKPTSFGAAYDGSTIKFFADNSRQSIAQVWGAGATGQGIAIGKNDFSGQEFDGAIAEVLIYLRTLDDNEINKTQSYLMNKWGI